MSGTVNYRGYHGSIIYDAEDNLHHGRILGVPDMVIYHGDSPEEAERIFHESVDDYLADFEKLGQEPPTPFAEFPASLPEELQIKAALYAHEHQVAPEKVLQMALSDFLDHAA